MDADGDNQRRLTVPPQLGSDYARTRCPSGLRTAKRSRSCASYRGRTDIWVTGPDGVTTRRLTKDAGAHTWPAWSPDGRRIAYVHALAKRQGIVVMTADGTGAKRVAGGAIAYAYPDWQPVR